MFVNYTFQIDDAVYYYWHKGGWAETERAVEIPLGLRFLQSCGPCLEVGNVTRAHISRLSYDVIDLNEQRPGWSNYRNADVLTHTPERDYDGVLSISTVEHTDDIVGAIRRILGWSRRCLVTYPLGYKTPSGVYTDDCLSVPFEGVETRILVRETADPYGWRPIAIEDAARRRAELRYGGFERGAAAIVVLERR